MNKEYRRKIAEFIRTESTLMSKSEDFPSDPKTSADLLKFRHDKSAWLTEIGGGKTVVKPEDVMQLESMVREAAAEITRAAKINKQMVQYINAAIEDRSHGMDGYERVVDDYSQLEALAEMSAQKLVRNLEKFNKRVNGKGFLNVVMCKFKKAKAQENANENQGPSVE